jgi:hypothetical protein
VFRDPGLIDESVDVLDPTAGERGDDLGCAAGGVNRSGLGLAMDGAGANSPVFDISLPGMSRAILTFHASRSAIVELMFRCLAS